MPESFGARLREQRERQQIVLAAIADQTKIKLSLLEGLERDDISRWPDGIFRRAYIRAYASAIGLDADVVLRDFLQMYPEPVDEIATEATGGAAGGPPTRLRYLVGTAIGALARLPRSKAQNPPSPIADVATAPAVPKSMVEPSPAPATEPSEPDPDLLSAAQLCTSLSRIDDVRQAKPLLDQIARVFDATGLMLWTWDAGREKLMPTLARGYSPQVLAHLPGVRRDAHNATAAAFRSARPCTVDGGDAASGALVVPLMAPRGCVGVLALELPRHRERLQSVRALAMIVAAQLARLLVVTSSAGGETVAPAGAAEALAVS
jgi:transcriptional regulator with XRE-family HTH domain